VRVARLRSRRLRGAQLLELQVGRSERIPALAQVERRYAGLGRGVVAAVDCARRGAKADQGLFELAHVRPSHPAMQVATHRDVAGKHEHRAAVDGQRDVSGVELARRRGERVTMSLPCLTLDVPSTAGCGAP
jgi:hypothetical protein